jgi:hypothetical protein
VKWTGSRNRERKAHEKREKRDEKEGFPQEKADFESRFLCFSWCFCFGSVLAQAKRELSKPPHRKAQKRKNGNQNRKNGDFCFLFSFSCLFAQKKRVQQEEKRGKTKTKHEKHTTKTKMCVFWSCSSRTSKKWRVFVGKTR